MFGVVLFTCWRAAQSCLWVRTYRAAVIPRLSLGWLSQRWASPVEDPCISVPSEEGWEVAPGQVRMARQTVNCIRKAERTGCDWCLLKLPKTGRQAQKKGHSSVCTQAGCEQDTLKVEFEDSLVQACCNKIQRHVVVPSDQIGVACSCSHMVPICSYWISLQSIAVWSFYSL